MRNKIADFIQIMNSVNFCYQGDALFMNVQDKFDQIMQEAAQVAIATLTVDGQAPDVRIVLFVYLPETHQLLFMSGADSAKVAEITAHSVAAFTTQAVSEQKYARAKQAKIQKVTLTDSMKQAYFDKFPNSAAYAAHNDFFTVDFNSVDVTADKQTETLTF
ncbi:pyridoxamine 5'-phosphate oxidase family protein [Loigolactobacillus backii]|nr:pyridoxamine 5'-phosphate oxidase family protein [Loigolactobacillus backii]MDA5386661.1 pyridoxamine 5'-phosphate oxidase family protein [Loigolactobacillus backii]MDA5389188.1 pyridoxamine 5'-phosphate oxidase family protein [Loigolactobacillus backii]